MSRETRSLEYRRPWCREIKGEDFSIKVKSVNACIPKYVPSLRGKKWLRRGIAESWIPPYGALTTSNNEEIQSIITKPWVFIHVSGIICITQSHILNKQYTYSVQSTAIAAV